MPGFFVTFEGVEGSGKTTQLLRLNDNLQRRAIHPKLFREPGGTPIAERVREIFLAPELSPNAATEAFLLEAARADLVTTAIGPLLADGAVVLCDRFSDSTLAYQGAGRGISLDSLRILNDVATGGLRPHLTFLLDVDPVVGLQRKFSDASEINRLELEDVGFHERVRNCFLELAAAEPERFVVLPGAWPPDLLHQEIFRIFQMRSQVALGE